MKKILITGITGSLGKHLLPMLLKNGYQVFATIRENSQINLIESNHSTIEFIKIDETLSEKISKLCPNYIIHLATDYGRNGLDLGRMNKTNIQFPLTILQAAMEMDNPPVFLNTDTSLHQNVSPYALSKLQFKEWLLFYNSRIKVVNIVLENFYGTNNNQFVSIMMNKIKNGVKEIDLTMGTQRRDFIHIDDVVSAYSTILKNCSMPNQNFTEFEIGSGESITIKKLLNTMMEITENKTTKLNWGAVAYRENEEMLSTVNISSLQALGWKPVLDLQAGFTKLLSNLEA